MAGPSVEFITNASDNDVARYISSAQGSIFPGLDDFGISAVEALASGTPVIAFKAGGAIDYIKENINGIFFTKQTVQSLSDAIELFDSNNFDPQKIKQSVAKFDAKTFNEHMLNFISD